MTRSGPVARLIAGAVRAGIAPGLVAAWRGPNDERPVTAVAGRAMVVPYSTRATEETRFDLASLTKPLVVGTLSLLTIRNGDLALETRVGEILPEFKGSRLSDRSVLQLLTHTSGLPAWEPLYALSPGLDHNPVEALRQLTVEEAGQNVAYSCPGFIILGMILERLAGVDLDELFTTRVLRPLKIRDELGFRPTPSSRVAGGAGTPGAERTLLEERGFDPGHIPEVAPYRPDDGNARFLGDVAGNAGLFGTVAGVLEVARTYLVPDLLLAADEIATATTNHTLGLEQARGLAWQLAATPGCSAGPALPSSAFGHSGFTGTSLWIDPDRGVAMTLLTNRNHPGHRLNDLHPLRRRFHQLVVEQY